MKEGSLCISLNLGLNENSFSKYSTTELTEQTRLQSNISIFSNDREYHNVDRLKTVVDHALHLIGKEQYVLLTLFVIVSEYIYFLQ